MDAMQPAVEQVCTAARMQSANTRFQKVPLLWGDGRGCGYNLNFVIECDNGDLIALRQAVQNMASGLFDKLQFLTGHRATAINNQRQIQGQPNRGANSIGRGHGGFNQPLGDSLSAENRTILTHFQANGIGIHSSRPFRFWHVPDIGSRNHAGLAAGFAQCLRVSKQRVEIILRFG